MDQKNNFSSLNMSASSGAEDLGSVEIVSLVMYSVVVLLGTTGNALVIYVTAFKMRTTVNSVWFLNLAIADFVFTFFLIFTIVRTYLRYWPFRDFLCKFNTLVQVINMFASIFLLTAISLDRCLATWVVVWAQNKRTPNKARLICLLIWLLSLACSLPYAVYREVEYYDGKYICDLIMDEFMYRKLSLFRFLAGFIVPFLVITCSYVAIGVRAFRLQKKRKMKPFKVILSVILAFFFCWLPFHITDLIFAQQTVNHYNYPDEFNADLYNLSANMSRLTVTLGFFNSCLNPILYVFMCEEFKNKLRQSVLLVLEHAFAEENLAFITSRYSVGSRHSESNGNIPRKPTLTSLVQSNERRQSIDDDS
ncbi:C3a anaphylatoxin chemotactic receptor-like [Denticeps clupeoides]|uniref:Si:dkey-42l23.7 n=1 Tax=Denticeps clupeoides TaxID=299321 RepID=A0AAY4ETH3_9TELE|nr:C3a anaphylatoxin chemotactic receptor-like [Denticeps clupeoides]